MEEKQKIDFKPKVLEFVQRNGPSLPVQISKIIERESYISSAVLSELANSKKILISHAKFGGSPLYYVPGQEYKLQSMLYPHLKDKEKEAFDLLKKNLVLKDSNLEPAIRVAIRYLRDFAVQIDVNDNNKTQIFWKWYILPDEEAKSKIIKLMGRKEEVKPIIEQKEIKEIIEEKHEEIKPKEEVKEIKEEKQESLLQKIKSRIIRKPKSKDMFEERVYEYLQKNQIKVVNSEIIKKNKEINMVIKLPSVVGDLTLFLKALNKAKISNTDLLIVHNEAQQKNMNGLLLTSGSSTKKVEEFIEKRLKGQLILKKL